MAESRTGWPGVHSVLVAQNPGLLERCDAYVDDIVVFGRTLEEHNENLQWMLELC